MGKNYTRFGLILSISYCVALAYVVYRRWDQLFRLPLNEFGDFLAGAFGPLAILWLVLGYFQQGVELRQNSLALRMQADELANSVEQQRQLVEVAKKQYETDREALQHEIDIVTREQARQRAASQPNFLFQIEATPQSLRGRTFTIEVSNSGAVCTKVRLVAEGFPLRFSPTEVSLLASEAAAKFTLSIPMVETRSEWPFNISFVDALGQPCKKAGLLQLSKRNELQIEIV